MARGKQFKLGTVFYGLGQTVWSWLDPAIEPTRMIDFDYHRRVVQEAEAAKLDFVFIGDSPYCDAQSWPSKLNKFEPLTLLAALSAVTSRIGLVSTQTTSFLDPYTVARQFASLDVLSQGRAGWNVVTSAEQRAAFNFSMDRPIDHDERYRRADEHLAVVKGLWDSWEDDAFVYDRENHRFFDPDKLHTLDHKGEYFSVKGPLNIQRSPQGHPVIAQAGSSDVGIEFGTRVADIIYTGVRSLEICQDVYRKLKAQTASHGRSPDDIVVMPGISPIIGSTQAEADRIFEQQTALADISYALIEMGRVFLHDFTQYPLDEPFPDLKDIGAGGWQSRCEQITNDARRLGLTLRQTAQRFSVMSTSFIGTPEKIADEMEEWFDGSAADGFILNSGIIDSLSDFIEHVLPILRKRGLFREEYEATTLRGNLGLPIPRNRYASAVT